MTKHQGYTALLNSNEPHDELGPESVDQYILDQDENTVVRSYVARIAVDLYRNKGGIHANYAAHHIRHGAPVLVQDPDIMETERDLSGLAPQCATIVVRSSELYDAIAADARPEQKRRELAVTIHQISDEQYLYGYITQIANSDINFILPFILPLKPEQNEQEIQTILRDIIANAIAPNVTHDGESMNETPSNTDESVALDLAGSAVAIGHTVNSQATDYAAPVTEIEQGKPTGRELGLTCGVRIRPHDYGIATQIIEQWFNDTHDRLKDLVTLDRRNTRQGWRIEHVTPNRVDHWATNVRMVKNENAPPCLEVRVETTQTRYQAALPKLIAMIASATHVDGPDGLISNEVEYIHAQAAFSKLMIDIVDPERVLPILIMTLDRATGNYIIDPAKIARYATGALRIVSLSDRFARDLRAEWGQNLAVFSGAARIYMPGFNPDDANPYAHPRVLAQQADGDSRLEMLIRREIGATIRRYGIEIENDNDIIAAATRPAIKLSPITTSRPDHRADNQSDKAVTGTQPREIEVPVENTTNEPTNALLATPQAIQPETSPKTNKTSPAPTNEPSNPDSTADDAATKQQEVAESSAEGEANASQTLGEHETTDKLQPSRDKHPEETPATDEDEEKTDHPQDAGTDKTTPSTPPREEPAAASQGSSDQRATLKPIEAKPAPDQTASAETTNDEPAGTAVRVETATEVPTPGPALPIESGSIALLGIIERMTRYIDGAEQRAIDQENRFSALIETLHDHDKRHLERARALQSRARKNDDEHKMLLTIAEQERDEALEEVRQLQTKLQRMQARMVVGGQSALPQAKPIDMSEIAEWANEAYVNRLVILPRAARALKKTNYADVERVIGCIEMLAGSYWDMKNSVEGAYQRFQDDLTTLRLINEPNGEGGGAEAAQWTIDYQGRRMRMALHLKGKESGKRDRVLRVYYHYDEISNQVLVGWLPDHLTTAAT